MTTASFIPTVAQATDAGYYPARRTVDVTAVRKLTDGVYRLTFRDAFIAAKARPAQFVNLYSRNPLHMSPRPFGVADVDGDEVSIIFAVVGYGTDEFSRMRAGDRVDVLGPLGKPYDTKASANYVLVGGGLGIPPLIRAAQVLSARADTEVTAVFGYRNDHFAQDIVAPFADRAYAIDESEGNVITLLERLDAELAANPLPPVILSCGPLPMLKAVAAWAAHRSIRCQFSLEERMGCGYGTCVVCVVDTVDGRQKVCVDGPVFTPEQLGWGK
ncbi:MAG: dihydroorotate dehydrogenase electron transfer subunit [Bifidobacterium sp.]|nr:dihydroorotate dehydrogenase electron transfer subunit [Bifidobacterium sp.]